MRRAARNLVAFLDVLLFVRRVLVRSLALALLALLALGSVACSTKSDGAPRVAQQSSTALATHLKPFDRTCATSVSGTLDAPSWKKHSIIAGPVVFYYADQFAQEPASSFAHLPGRKGYYPGQKLLILVRVGTSATVLVSEPDRRHANLLYDPAGWNDSNAYRVRDGQSAVRFTACRAGEQASAGDLQTAFTQFNGSLVVAGARCLPLQILAQGEQGPIAVKLSFGVHRCSG